jgi:uncharacterized OB-fold protein
MNERPIAPDLFRPGPEPRLIGGRHRLTGKLVFPLDAGDADYEACELPPRGTLWSFTVQRFRPKTPPYAGPEAFEPYAVGYVELPGALIVESRLTGIRFEDLRIGMPLQLTTMPLGTAADGSTLTTYAFGADLGAAH